MALPHINGISSLSLPEMERYAAQLAEKLQAGDMITLRGELGAGKTALARALIQALNKQAVEVTSPTFNLMQSYDVTLADGRADTLWHLDLYRLEEASEAEMLGLRELEQHVMLIEWPEIIEHTLPSSRLDIMITLGDGETRNLDLYGNEIWNNRIKAIK